MGRQLLCQCTGAQKPTAASGGAGLNADDVPAVPGDETKTDGQAAAAGPDAVPAGNGVRLQPAVLATPQPSS
jgi:hypothetical protein